MEMAALSGQCLNLLAMLLLCVHVAVLFNLSSFLLSVHACLAVLRDGSGKNQQFKHS